MIIMNYRLQDILKLIIPGLYLMALVFTWLVIEGEITTEDIKSVKDIVPIIVLLIPFVGFVVGYFSECMMSLLEHLWYSLGGRRPSKTILKGSRLYHLDGAEKILVIHGLTATKLTNDEANQVLHTAKQTIDRTKVEDFRTYTALSRNIFGCQMLFTNFYLLGTEKLCLCFTIILLTITVMFFIYWMHHNHVYVKYVLAEYRNINKI